MHIRHFSCHTLGKSTPPLKSAINTLAPFLMHCISSSLSKTLFPLPVEPPKRICGTCARLTVTGPAYPSPSTSTKLSRERQLTPQRSTSGKSSPAGTAYTSTRLLPLAYASLTMFIPSVVSMAGRFFSHSSIGMLRLLNSHTVTRGLPLSRHLRSRSGGIPAWFVRPMHWSLSLAIRRPIGQSSNARSTAPPNSR